MASVELLKRIYVPVFDAQCSTPRYLFAGVLPETNVRSSSGYIAATEGGRIAIGVVPVFAVNARRNEKRIKRLLSVISAPTQLHILTRATNKVDRKGIGHFRSDNLCENHWTMRKQAETKEREEEQKQWKEHALQKEEEERMRVEQEIDTGKTRISTQRAWLKALDGLLRFHSKKNLRMEEVDRLQQRRRADFKREFTKFWEKQGKNPAYR